MAKLVVSTSVGEGALWLYLDNRVIIENSEMASLDLETGQEYIVHWFVKGKPGMPYTITISSPRDAQYQLTQCVQVSGKGFGGISFRG